MKVMQFSYFDDIGRQPMVDKEYMTAVKRRQWQIRFSRGRCKRIEPDFGLFAQSLVDRQAYQFALCPPSLALTHT